MILLLKCKSHGLHPEYLVLIYSEITLIDLEKLNAAWNLLGSSLSCSACIFSNVPLSPPGSSLSPQKSIKCVSYNLFNFLQKITVSVLLM